MKISNDNWLANMELLTATISSGQVSLETCTAVSGSLGFILFPVMSQVTLILAFIWSTLAWLFAEYAQRYENLLLVEAFPV